MGPLGTPGEMVHHKALTENEDLNSIPKTHAKSQACQYTLVIPAMGKRRQADLWYSLVSQPSQICRSQNVRDPASKHKVYGS